MAETDRDRAKRYDAIGSAVWTFGPLVVALFSAGQWLFSIVTAGGYVSLAAVAFNCALIGLASLWAIFRLRRKRS